MSNESGHWYDENANACHTVIAKSTGKPRNTTLADAKRLGLYPSVSGILSVLSKDSLADWKHRQITEAAFMTQPKPMETPEAYHSRIMDAAFKQVADAADLGTRIHKAIEQHFQGEEYDKSLEVYVGAVDKWSCENGVNFHKQELRLVNKEFGFAGTTDAAISRHLDYAILDFKSRKTRQGQKVEPWETQILQIAAYAYTYYGMDGFKKPCGVNVYISTTEPGRVEASWYTAEQVAEAWEMFKKCCDLWRYMKGYDPRAAKKPVSIA